MPTNPTADYWTSLERENAELRAALEECYGHLCNAEFNNSEFVIALRLKARAALRKAKGG